MCTASSKLWTNYWIELLIDCHLILTTVLNLCAISIDRYLAVTRPVRYRSIMTSKRAKIFIACVWVLSFIICFPPVRTLYWLIDYYRWIEILTINKSIRLLFALISWSVGTIRQHLLFNPKPNWTYKKLLIHIQLH